MKGMYVLVLMAIFSGLFLSCVSIQDRTLLPEERNEAELLGVETVKFVTAQWLHIINKENIKNKAYSLLREKAEKKYQGAFEIRNIAITGSFNGWTIPANYFAGFLPLYINIQTITAIGEIRSIPPASRANATEQMVAPPDDQALQKKLDNAIASTTLRITDRLRANSTIAVLSVFSSNRNTSEYIIGELEYHFVNNGKFTIVDRRRLDQIRNEQNFQISGDVSDDSAVSIGNMLGANIVITGELTGAGSDHRLMLKAIDVQTAQIIAMAREQL